MPMLAMLIILAHTLHHAEKGLGSPFQHVTDDVALVLSIKTRLLQGYCKVISTYNNNPEELICSNETLVACHAY